MENNEKIRSKFTARALKRQGEKQPGQVPRAPLKIHRPAPENRSVHVLPGEGWRLLISDDYGIETPCVVAFHYCGSSDDLRLWAVEFFCRNSGHIEQVIFSSSGRPDLEGFIDLIGPGGTVPLWYKLKALWAGTKHLLKR